MKVINKIKKIIKKHRLVSDRIKALKKTGIKCKEVAMGSGGVGQVKYLPTLNETRIQVGYGHGRHNYAQAAILTGDHR